MSAELHHGDCLEVLRTLPDCSVDAVVTDPPYGLSFMGKHWDHGVPSADVWRECLRVLKPGGHLLAFAGTRTQHRMACAIEDAGFEIRDMIAWAYGSGFPKSLDVSKAIDKAAGAEREVVETIPDRWAGKGNVLQRATQSQAETVNITAPATEAARQWQGFGTALKPALEPITVARKPFKSTVAANVLEHGTGALNIDGCRIGISKNIPASPAKANDSIGTFKAKDRHTQSSGFDANIGRWPANLIHDGSDEVVGLFPVTASGAGGQPQTAARTGNSGLTGLASSGVKIGHGDTGSAARFFYCAKASKADRDEGNHHPTVKPTDLMRYLCRLVTPPGGVVLDPFMGSGSTGKAARMEGFRFVGIEREQEYIEIARARIDAVRQEVLL